MPTFITFVKWTDQGIRNVRDTVKRAKEITTQVQNSGGAVKGIYWTMGQYDVVIIFEAPDDTTATALLMFGGSLGNIRTETVRAFPEGEMENILEKIHQLG
jgi:uncharacterized protein with GYD domain